MRYTFLLLLLFGIGLQHHLKAQPMVGCPTQMTTGLSDTVVMSTTVSYIIEVVNTGNQPIFGAIDVFVGVYDSTGTYTGIVDSSSFQPMFQPFNPNDTAQVLITHDIDNSKFSEGNNTVVIWPSQNSAITTDSTFKDIYVVVFNTIDELGAIQVNLFPNPVKETLFLASNVPIEQVRVYNLNGQYLNCNYRSGSIDFSTLSPGLYIVECVAHDGRVKRFKIMKD